jgi:hypothetical protein
MIVHELRDAPPPKLAQALDQFEEQFQYPLGPGQSFRIIHGEDYPRFFRAMGEGICFVAEKEGRVVGVIGAAVRRLTLPTGENQSAVYFGDVKIDPTVRGGKTLLRLARAVQNWIGTEVTAAFAVVMDGTTVSPTRYTGRLGIPLFSELGKIAVLRFSTPGSKTISDEKWQTNEEQGAACYLQLCPGKYACPGGDSALRSETEPVWLMEPTGRASGRLEDTRRAKRLIADDGIEMQSAHLSCFEYGDRNAGINLLQIALQIAADRKFPHLFVAVPVQETDFFIQSLKETEPVVATATVFGTGLPSGPTWNINTAEI